MVNINILFIDSTTHLFHLQVVFLLTWSWVKLVCFYRCTCTFTNNRQLSGHLSHHLSMCSPPVFCCFQCTTKMLELMLKNGIQFSRIYMFPYLSPSLHYCLLQFYILSLFYFCIAPNLCCILALLCGWSSNTSVSL